MATNGDLRVLGISGSLRHGSYNTAALRVAQRVVPPGLAIETCDIHAVPLYNEDVYAKGFPPPVEELREKIRAADAVLIVTPEYNYSIPGVLKNAIDWVSRPPDQPFRDKPVALMGASIGMLGTARAQYHLRQSFVLMDARVMSRPEVMIAGAAQKFDAAGELTDPQTAEKIGGLLAALRDWTLRLRR